MTSSILITGAAKRIGALLAEHLAAQGRSLVLHYHRSEKEALALAARLKQQHKVEVALVQADLSKPEAFSHFWKSLPPCVAFIHNASVFKRDTLENFTPEQLRMHLALHVEAPLLLSQGFLAQLPKNEQGSITIIGDAAFGWSIAPQFFSYAVSKHAWASGIDLLAAACAPRARANLLQLGPTLPGEHEDAALFGKLAERAALKRTTEPADVLAAIDYLLHSPSVTGQVLSLAAGVDLTTLRSNKG